MLKAFGNDLKLLRESKGITIAEIAAQTRINPKFLISLEAGIFDFQPETYIRAFIKAYARGIDINENYLLTEYDKAKAGFYQPKNILKDKTAGVKKYLSPVLLHLKNQNSYHRELKYRKL